MAPRPTRDVRIDDSHDRRDLARINPNVKQGMREEQQRQQTQRKGK